MCMAVTATNGTRNCDAHGCLQSHEELAGFKLCACDHHSRKLRDGQPPNPGALGLGLTRQRTRACCKAERAGACSYFGELALLYDQPRAATVRATAKCKLWVMERSVYNTIFHQDIKLVREAKMALVASMPIFKALSETLQGTLCDALQPLEKAANTVLFYKGDEGQLFYIVKGGTVEISIGDKVRPAAAVPAARLLHAQRRGQLRGRVARSCPRRARLRLQPQHLMHARLRSHCSTAALPRSSPAARRRWCRHCHPGSTLGSRRCGRPTPRAPRRWSPRPTAPSTPSSATSSRAFWARSTRSGASRRCRRCAGCSVPRCGAQRPAAVRHYHANVQTQPRAL